MGEEWLKAHQANFDFLLKIFQMATKSIMIYDYETDLSFNEPRIPEIVRRAKEKHPELIIKIIVGPIVLCVLDVDGEGKIIKRNRFLDLEDVEVFVRSCRGKLPNLVVVDDKVAWMEKRYSLELGVASPEPKERKREKIDAFAKTQNIPILPKENLLDILPRLIHRLPKANPSNLLRLSYGHMRDLVKIAREKKVDIDYLPIETIKALLHESEAKRKERD